MPPFVAIVIATFRRSAELVRLLVSLDRVTVPHAVIVVDNADDPETERAVEAANRPEREVVRLVPGENLGCGGGLAFGEEAVLLRYRDRFTHVWIMDDDAEVRGDALERLIAAMAEESAWAACPMIASANGTAGWMPYLLDRAAWNAISDKPLAEAQAFAGSKRYRFSWSTGVALLVSREAILTLGLHRTDFWIRGEDLEFSLRITENHPGIFVPDAVVAHLPPDMSGSVAKRDLERKRHRALVQNVAFIGFRLSHGRRILHTVAPNVWRFTRAWGPLRIFEAFGAVWNGAVLALPAGAKQKAGQQTVTKP